MFGNLQGWIASLVIAGLTVGLIYWKGTSEGISKPTGSLAVAMAPVAIAPDPNTVLPPGTKDADAGEIYRELAAAVGAKEQAYEDFRKAAGPKKRAAAKPLEPDMELLVRAGECGRMDLFAKNPGEVVNYANRKPVLPELQQAGAVGVGVAALWLTPDSNSGSNTKKGKGKGKAEPVDPAKGRRLLEAVFHLGRFLAEERVSFDEYRIGVDLMGSAAHTLARFGNVDASRKDALTRLAAAATVKEYEAVVRTITGIPGEGKLMAAPGDVFDVALNGREPMWRTEAVLKLGRMRWMTGVKFGDQRGAGEVLKDLAGRADLPPNVKAAAVAGRDLTVERFRMIGGGA